jgi:hypothetical protein
MHAYLKNNPGISVDQIDSELQRRASSDIRAPGSDGQALYLHARAQEAQILRTALHLGGVRGLSNNIATRLTYKRDRLYWE